MANDEVLHIWSPDDGEWVPIQTDEELDQLCQDDRIDAIRFEIMAEHESDDDDLC